MVFTAMTAFAPKIIKTRNSFELLVWVNIVKLETFHSYNDIKKLPNIIRLLSICPELTLTRTNPSTNLEAHSNHKILAGYFTYVPQLQCILCVRPCENICLISPVLYYEDIIFFAIFSVSCVLRSLFSPTVF